MKLSKTVHYDIQIGKSSEHIVSSTIGTYNVDIERLTCTCSFKQTLGLPCRHLFFARSYLQLTTFVATMVSDQWLKSYQMFDKIAPEDARAIEVMSNQSMQIDKLSMKPKDKSSLSQSQKYTKMFNTCQKLAAIASHCGMSEFCKKFLQSKPLLNCGIKTSHFFIQKVCMSMK